MKYGIISAKKRKRIGENKCLSAYGYKRLFSTIRGATRLKKKRSFFEAPIAFNIREKAEKDILQDLGLCPQTRVGANCASLT